MLTALNSSQKEVVERTLDTAVNILDDVGEMLTIDMPSVHSMVISQSSCNEIVGVLKGLSAALNTEREKMKRITRARSDVVSYLPLS